MTSMKACLGMETVWDRAISYFLEFCHNSEELHGEDLISCVGYSDEAEIRVNAFTPTAAKTIKKWELMGLDSRLLLGLEKAYDLSEAHPQHRTIFVCLSDGFIENLDECVKFCESIK
jgi:hypothetical protein